MPAPGSFCDTEFGVPTSSWKQGAGTRGATVRLTVQVWGLLWAQEGRVDRRGDVGVSAERRGEIAPS